MSQGGQFRRLPLLLLEPVAAIHCTKADKVVERLGHGARARKALQLAQKVRQQQVNVHAIDLPGNTRANGAVEGGTDRDEGRAHQTGRRSKSLGPATRSGQTFGRLPLAGLAYSWWIRTALGRE